MQVEVLAVPYDSGHRGLRMGAGPEHLLAGGLISKLENLGHTVRATVLEAPAGSWRITAVGTIGRELPLHAAALTAYDPSCDTDGRVRDAAIRVAPRWSPPPLTPGADDLSWQSPASVLPEAPQL